MEEKIKEICLILLEHMLIFDAGVKVKRDDGLYQAEIDLEEPGTLIGKNGEMMRAFEIILRLLVSRKLKEPINISVDIAGYKKKREKEISEMGVRAAESALKTGRAQVLMPMNAYERRIVHLSLKEHSDIETESIGEEPNRCVVIKTKKKTLV